MKSLTLITRALNHLLLISKSSRFSTFFLCVLLCLYFVLTIKNPYNDTSLIGNFDPFPDTFHYVVPARNLVAGNGFTLSRPQGQAPINVPPVYSLFLIPFYFINFDPRTFFIANLSLGFTSLILLYLITHKVSQNTLIAGAVSLIYATTYVIYWQPTLAMAENMLLPLLLFCFYVWLKTPTLTRDILMVIFAISLYGTKYVALPLTLIWLTLVFLRYFRSSPNPHRFRSVFILTIISAITFFTLDGTHLILVLRSLAARFNPAFHPGPDVSWFSVSNIVRSWGVYGQAFLGQPVLNLFSYKPLLPPLLGPFVLIFSLLLIVGKPRTRTILIPVVALIIAQMSLLLLIIQNEGRYAYVLIPLTLIGFAHILGYLTRRLQKKFSKKISQLFPLLLLFTVITLIAIFRTSELKAQVRLNLKGGEVPWWKVGIVETDSVIQKYTVSGKNTVVITSLPPFLWDFYRTGEYQLMPFGHHLQFDNADIWGFSTLPQDWISFALSLNNSGSAVYVTTVGFQPQDWDTLETYKSLVNLEMVHQTCHDSCKLFLLK